MIERIEEMINLTDIHSVTDFQRNPKGILGKLKNSKNPVILTVNGRAELVVQDAKSYQDLLDKVQDAEDLDAIREGLQQSFNGSGRPVANFFADFEASNDL